MSTVVVQGDCFVCSQFCAMLYQTKAKKADDHQQYNILSAAIVVFHNEIHHPASINLNISSTCLYRQVRDVGWVSFYGSCYHLLAYGL